MSRDEADSDITRVNKASYRGRYWLPEPTVEQQADRQQGLGRSFWLTTSVEQIGLPPDGLLKTGSLELQPGFTPLNASTADHYVAHMEVNSRVSLKQRHFKYFYYPFDRQTIVVDFATSDFTLETCGTPVASGSSSSFLDMEPSEMLPSGGEYSLDPDCGGVQSLQPPLDAEDISAKLSRYRVPHKPVATYPTTGGCRMVICLIRRPASYMLQFLIPSTLVTLSTLAALIISPIQADLATARASVLLVSLLLLVESSSSVWHGTFLDSWSDYFGISQIAYSPRRSSKHGRCLRSPPLALGPPSRSPSTPPSARPSP